jgi:hypothetical protein
MGTPKLCQLPQVQVLSTRIRKDLMTNQLRWELLESGRTAQNRKFKALKELQKSRRRFRKLKESK